VVALGDFLEGIVFYDFYLAAFLRAAALSVLSQESR